MVSYNRTLDHAQKVELSVEQIRLAAAMSERYYSAPLLLCYSGGKDSDALVELAGLAGIDFEVQYSRTTADAPETVQHVRKTFARLESEGIECKVILPRFRGEPVTMWKLIPEKLMPPTRLARYCCKVLKETGGAGRAIATGVRRAESIRRSSRRFANNFSARRPASIDFEDAAELFEQADSFAVHDSDFIRSCRIRGSTSFQPMLEWLDDDVWQFIDERGVEYCSLYDEGWKRIGCVGCPFAGAKLRSQQFERWPKFKEAYLRAFDAMLEVRNEKCMETEWKTAEEVFSWWMETEEE